MRDKFDCTEMFECIERIEKLFWYDTIVLLDCVLSDDSDTPEYSANTVYNRLEDVVEFQRLYFDEKIYTVSDLLIKNGYSTEDADLLDKKRFEEDRRYS